MYSFSRIVYCQRQTVLAQQVNFFKVSRRDSLGNMMIGVAPMLNARAKNRHLSESCSGALRHTNLQLCWAGELRPFEMVIQRRFDLIRRQDDRRLYFKFIPSRASYQFKTLDEAGVCFAAELSKYQKVRKNLKRSPQDHTEKSFRMTIFFIWCCTEGNLSWNLNSGLCISDKYFNALFIFF